MLAIRTSHFPDRGAECVMNGFFDILFKKNLYRCHEPAIISTPVRPNFR